MDWKTHISNEQEKPYYQALATFVKTQRASESVYPPEAQVFTVFEQVAFDDVKVVILGQDPYHQPGQAMGMSFSVPKDFKLPKSLVNIFKELNEDLGIQNTQGDLTSWADQGVFLLNTLLTVRESEPMSHQKQGWEMFTDSVISKLGERKDPIIFVLWGKKAQDKKHLVQPHHYFIESSHPSPLGAYRGFMGSKPFSKINTLLREMGKDPIDWSTDV